MKLYPAGISRLGQQAGGRHAGNGVGLQYVNIPAPEDHVRAAVSPAEKGLVGHFRVGLRRFGDGVIDTGRANFLGDAGRVLGLVIEKFVGRVRDDFDEGKGLKVVVAHHTAGQLDTLDVGFRQDGISVSKGFFKSFFQILRPNGQWSCPHWSPPPRA